MSVGSNTCRRSSPPGMVVTFPVLAAASSAIHFGASCFGSRSARDPSNFFSFFDSLNPITSPGRTWYEGMFTFSPFTVMKPWLTIWRGRRRVRAKPRRYTTLSNRVSRSCTKYVAVFPFLREAASKYLRNWRSSTLYKRFAFCFSRSCVPYEDKRGLRFDWSGPCAPGGNGRRLNAQFSRPHSETPSRRHNLHVVLSETPIDQ